MAKKFLIVIDTQYDFMMANGKLPVAGAEDIIAPTIRFLAGLDPEQYAGVLFTYDTHVPEVYAGSPESEQFPIHCVKGTPGWENVFNPTLVPPLVPVFRLTKGVFNMWEEPEEKIRIERLYDLDDAGDGSIEWVPFMSRDVFAAEMHGDMEVDTVTVIGVAADFCVKWAIDGLVERGFNVEVPADLTRGIVRQFDQVAREDFAGHSVKIV